jgi:hypothetical protein
LLRFRESAIEEWLFELERESWSCVGPDRGVGCGRP